MITQGGGWMERRDSECPFAVPAGSYIVAVQLEPRQGVPDPEEVLSELLEPELEQGARAWLTLSLQSTWDQYGRRARAHLWPTPGWFNDGLGGYYREGTDPAVVQAAWEANPLRKAHHIRSDPGRYPAWTSVAFVVNEHPGRVFDTLAARAKRLFPNFLGLRILRVVLENVDP